MSTLPSYVWVMVLVGFVGITGTAGAMLGCGGLRAGRTLRTGIVLGALVS